MAAKLDMIRAPIIKPLAIRSTSSDLTNLPLGIFQKLSQPELRLLIEIDEFYNFSHQDKLDRLLEHLFSIKFTSSKLENENVISKFTMRALWITCELMRASRIPVFDDPKIILLKKTGEGSNIKWMILVGMPCLDHLNASSISMTLSYSYKLIFSLAQNLSKGIDSDLSKYWDSIHNEVIKKLSASFRSGISTVPILAAAWEARVPFRHIGGSIFQLGWGCKSRRVGRSSVDGDSALGSSMANVKTFTAQALSYAGIPSPKHILVKTIDEALIAAKKIGWPIVIKPNDRERSEGVTIDISNNETLDLAFKAAFKYSKSILVEKQIAGICYRVMVANGKFLYALSRKPISVIGNGVDTIEQLISSLNHSESLLPAWKRKKTVPIDDELELVLVKQGLRMSSIPLTGQKVNLRFIESTQWGEDRSDASDQIHPENISLAERATAALGLVNAGVDIISLDISIPWYENEAVINEVNYAPHFGGTDIARQRMPKFISGLIDGDGRIPIEVFLGGEKALHAAMDWQRQMIGRGFPAWVCSDSTTIDHSGNIVHMPSRTSYERTIAILSNRHVAALAIVIEDSSWLKYGAPVDQINAWHDCLDPHIISKIDANLFLLLEKLSL
jgi:cyanophycin synthetase